MKKNKLSAKFIILITILIFSCVGCNKENNSSITESEAVNFSNKLLENGIFDSNLSKVSNDVTRDLYKINLDDVTIISSFMGDGTSSEEVVVIKGNKEDIKKIVEKYLKEKEDNYESYLPKEADKVQNAVLKQFSNYSILCISADSKKSKQLLSQ